MKYTLYAHFTQACEIAKQKTKGLPIDVQLIDKNEHPFIQGVPSLTDNAQKLIFQGSDCLSMLDTIKKELSSGIKPLQSSPAELQAVPDMQTAEPFEGKITSDMVDKILKERQQHFQEASV